MSKDKRTEFEFEETLFSYLESVNNFKEKMQKL